MIGRFILKGKVVLTFVCIAIVGLALILLLGWFFWAMVIPNRMTVIGRVTDSAGRPIKAVQVRVENGKKAYMDEVETVQIPRLNFDIEHYFTQLGGKKFTNKGFEKYGIGYAVQTVRFKLDEKGAIVKSEAKIATPCERGPEELKRLIFDKPFLICLKEKKGKYPYFAVWVDNPELLVKQ